MTKTNGRRLRGERARAEILTRSARIASIDGLEGLSIGRVAAEAGVGKGNIQVLFGDKESLQLATLEKAVELFHATVIFPAMNKKMMKKFFIVGKCFSEECRFRASAAQTMISGAFH